MIDPLPPPEDDELPPPPSDIAEEMAHYSEIKVKRSGPFATLRRAVTIFEKDLRTMAKHGLISSIILLIFLGLIFYIVSYTMTFALTFEFGEEGDEMSLPGATEHVPPVADAGSNRSIDAGQVVTLDASGSTDNAEIVYYQWSFWDGTRDIDLFGPTVDYRFMAVGDFDVNLFVLDSSWNDAEDTVGITVNSATSDTEQPMANAMANAEWETSVMAGSTVSFDGAGSTDNVGVVNWTWTFEDGIDRVLYGSSPDYKFDSAGYFWVSLTVRDASGNWGQSSVGVDVMRTGDDDASPRAEVDADKLVNRGDTVELDASNSWDDNSIVAHTWYIEHNGTVQALSGEVVTFEADEWGMYEVTLIVRDAAGNSEVWRNEVIALPEDIDVDEIPWTATPFGQDVSFNLLTFAYGTALLASVIYIGGLFAKGFAHEIQKGTVKALFFGPVSVTTVIFSKILYPIVIGPLFIFPLVLVSLAPFGQSTGDILFITLVSYLLAVLTMVAAAYGSCLIYLVTKRMVMKPTVISRMFMYLSLLGTMTVFEWLSFLFDTWFSTEMWGDIYVDHGASIAMFSPFHQGGVLLSNAIVGTSATPDWGLFAIPIVLIALGIWASHKLYPDLFSRE